MVATVLLLHCFSTGLVVFGTVYFGVFVKRIFSLQMMLDELRIDAKEITTKYLYSVRKKRGA